MLEDLRELWRYRQLLESMVRRELKIRYKNSFFGFLWSLLNPLATVMVMTFVFKYIMRIEVPNYSAYILAAYLPFVFFQIALLDCSMSVLGQLSLIKKIYFPREILPLSLIIANFIHFLLALVVFFAYLAMVWILNPAQPPFQISLVYLPLLLVINFALATGLGLIVSALNTFYEDVKYLLGVLLYLLVFLCPVMYFVEQVDYRFAHHGRLGEGAYLLFRLNPVATMCSAYRKVLLAPQAVPIGNVTVPPLPLDWPMVGYTAALSVVLLIYGYSLFNKLKWKFVERP